MNLLREIKESEEAINKSREESAKSIFSKGLSSIEEIKKQMEATEMRLEAYSDILRKTARIGGQSRSYRRQNSPKYNLDLTFKVTKNGKSNSYELVERTNEEATYLIERFRNEL